MELVQTMKYKKITKDDVYKVLVSISVDIMSPLDCINLVNIASFLKTSRYQVKKYIDELKAEGMVELISVCVPSEDELYPPYWGYALTRKGKDTDYYREEEKRIAKLIAEIFK